MASQNEDLSREQLYNSLLSLGNFYALDMAYDPIGISKTLEKYKNNWNQYNPRKTHIRRYGLALTSLDGGLSGVPDLDSLKEYNSEFGTEYCESSFRTPTKVLLENEDIRTPIQKFIPHLGRSHFIRLAEGGFFPFHRDSPAAHADTFRIISLLQGCESHQFCFLYDRQRIFLEVGQVYFLNTKIEHALFAFGEASTLMALNVIVSDESVRLVIDNLQSR